MRKEQATLKIIGAAGDKADCGGENTHSGELSCLRLPRLREVRAVARSWHVADARMDGVKMGRACTVVDAWTGQGRHAKLKRDWRGATSFVDGPNARSSQFLDCHNLLIAAPAEEVES